MALSDYSKDELVSYQLALSTALSALRTVTITDRIDYSSTIVTLRDLNSRVQEAIKDIDFEKETSLETLTEICATSQPTK